MKFNRCVWPRTPAHRWSPQRIAAAKRAVTREEAKVQARRDEVALFPELAAEHQPRFSNVEERQVIIDRREDWLTETFRRDRAASWRSARRRYFQLPPIRRAGIRRLWQIHFYPLDPAYLATMIQIYTAPGTSPWTHLRKKRLVVLMRDGRLPRPAVMMTITRDWKTL